jgi:hypothetical protein
MPEMVPVVNLHKIFRGKYHFGNKVNFKLQTLNSNFLCKMCKDFSGECPS